MLTVISYNQSSSLVKLRLWLSFKWFLQQCSMSAGFGGSEQPEG